MACAFDNPDFPVASERSINTFRMRPLDQMVCRAMNEKYRASDVGRQIDGSNAFHIKPATEVGHLLARPKKRTQDRARQTGEALQPFASDARQRGKRTVSPHRL